ALPIWRAGSRGGAAGSPPRSAAPRCPAALRGRGRTAPCRRRCRPSRRGRGRRTPAAGVTTAGCLRGPPGSTLPPPCALQLVDLTLVQVDEQVRGREPAGV